jgi:hypothetical protein
MQAHGMQAHGMQAHGMQAHGMQPHGMQAHGMQPHGMQAHGMQAHGMNGMQAHGMNGMQAHGMNGMYRMNDVNEIDLENIKTNDKLSSKKVISYIKNPLIVFIIFILLNSSITIQSIDNVFASCSNNGLSSIINLIVRGILAALLFFIISSLLKNI